MLLDLIPLSLFCFLSGEAGAAVFIICASLVFVRLSVCLCVCPGRLRRWKAHYLSTAFGQHFWDQAGHELSWSRAGES